jgi:hypothetical protein
VTSRRRLAILLGAALLVETGVSITSAGEPTTAPSVWIDQPLPGMAVPYGPVPVTIHAADPAGLATIRLLVDGHAAAQLAAPSGELVTVTWTWGPTSPGTHLLTVMAATADGTTSAPVSAGVTFVAPSTPPPSPSAAPSPSPAPSASPPPPASPSASPSPRASPSPTSCLPPAPDLETPGDASTSYASSGGDKPVFWWVYHVRPACSPTSFQLKLSQNSNLSSPLYVPLVLASSGSGYSWTWVPPSPLPYDRSCTTYYWNITALTASGSPGGTTATWSFKVCP